MNITKELQHYYSQGEEAIVSILNEQKDNIEKKIHLIQVVSVLNKIQNMLDNEAFRDAGGEFIQIKNFHDYDIGNVINFEILDKDKNIIDKYNPQENYIPIYDQLKELFDNVSLDYPFSNYQFKEKDERVFAIDINLVENLRWIFLSAELNASLSHALLDNDLDDKKLTSTKLKI